MPKTTTGIHNMYGFTPCPKCHREFRFSLHSDPRTVVCDDCGHKEPVSQDNAEYWVIADQAQWFPAKDGRK